MRPALMRCSSIYTSTVEAHCIRVEERKSAQATHQFRAVQGAGSRKAEVLCGTAAEKTNTYKEWNREWREKAVCCVEDRQGKWKSGKASRTSTVRQVFFVSSAVALCSCSSLQRPLSQSLSQSTLTSREGDFGTDLW